jgi:hypothetical protein
MLSYADAVGAMKTWINGRIGTLVGEGMPLQKGAEAKRLGGATPTCYAFLSLVGTTQVGGAENPDTAARLSAQVLGPNTQAVAIAAASLADELTRELAGRWTDVPGLARIYVAADIDGPSDQPDFDQARQVVDFSVIIAPI